MATSRNTEYLARSGDLACLDSLSESTKNELQKRSPADVANIIAEVVEDINDRSVKTINELVWKKIRGLH